MWISGIRHEKINYNLDNNLFILLLTDCNMIINIKKMEIWIL